MGDWKNTKIVEGEQARRSKSGGSASKRVRRKDERIKTRTNNSRLKKVEERKG